MKCKAIQELLLDYIDNKLSAGKSRKITEHISNCETCERIYERHQKTNEALKEFGEAVRTGMVDVEAPPLLPRRPIWARIWNGLKTPVPVWIPSAVYVAILLIFATLVYSPLELSVEWGRKKGGGSMGNITPPLAAESMLEFLIVPDLTDPGQLAASIETVEKFLEVHPEDLAMHAKLIEFYQAELKLNSLTKPSRMVLAKKLSLERERLIELMGKANLTEGDENVQE